MYQPVGAIDTLVLMPVAGIGAGQGAQHHHPGHEAQIGVRFTGPDKLIHLIGLGEASPRLGRGIASRSLSPGHPDRRRLSRWELNSSRLRCMAYSPMFPRQNRDTTGTERGRSLQPDKQLLSDVDL